MKLIPKNMLTKFTDTEWSLLWDKNGDLKPFNDLLQHIQDIPGVKEMYDIMEAEELGLGKF